MRKFILLLLLFPGAVCANNHIQQGILIGEANALLESVQIACGGISQELSQISGISIANTAVTATGTVAAGGALVAGIKKEKTDQENAEILAKMCANNRCDPDTVENMSDAEFTEKVLPYLIAAIEEVYKDDLMALRAEQMQKTEQSKKLGNWRTWLLAGTTTTNIASAVLSGLNRDQSDLIQHISVCNELVAKLRDMRTTLQRMGVSPMENPISGQLNDAVDWCGQINVADVEKIEKRMTAVMGTSIAGAAIGVAGVGVSAAANSDKIRNDNSDAGKSKETKLNTAANVMAGANIATGAVETGFNISLITLTKKLLKNAQMCEELL